MTENNFRKNDPEICGIININKQAGMTSHDVVARIRRILGTRKVGHTGTLDPDAEGVLPICVGRATKAADMLTASGKQYLARAVLGCATDTQDASGSVIKSSSVNVIETEILAAVRKFIGDTEQIPPMYSAVKVGGRKLYELARENKTVERSPRKIHISNIDITAFDFAGNSFEMLIDCSKGTYIRTLINDIGEELGCFAYMSHLTRTCSGSFKIENSYTLAETEDMMKAGDMSFLIPVDKVFSQYERIDLSVKAAGMVRNGVKVRAPKTAQDGIIYRVYDEEGRFLTLSRCDENRLKILKTFF